MNIGYLTKFQAASGLLVFMTSIPILRVRPLLKLLSILFFANRPDLSFERNQLIVLLRMTFLKLILFSTLKYNYMQYLISVVKYCMAFCMI